MSREYDIYLEQHKDNVRKGYEWIKVHKPELLNCIDDIDALDKQIMFDHDASKSEPIEYDPYDKWFYGGNRSYKVKQDFNYAWLHHIHNNPHHWQHWILHNDEPGEGMVVLDMQYDYVIEMICDWWAFSWAKGDLTEIFNWYDDHKDYMKLGKKTRVIVENILAKIREELDEEKKDE